MVFFKAPSHFAAQEATLQQVRTKTRGRHERCEALDRSTGGDVVNHHRGAEVYVGGRVIRSCVCRCVHSHLAGFLDVVNFIEQLKFFERGFESFNTWRSVSAPSRDVETWPCTVPSSSAVLDPKSAVPVRDAIRKSGVPPTSHPAPRVGDDDDVSHHPTPCDFLVCLYHHFWGAFAR